MAKYNAIIIEENNLLIILFHQNLVHVAPPSLLKTLGKCNLYDEKVSERRW